MDDRPYPTDIRLHRQSRRLEVDFSDGAHFEFSCEFLRVHSPSAEVQGHGAGEGVLQLGKEQVAITAIEPVGHYAVRLVFDDGHSTGLYTWDYLHHLGRRRDELWQRYLAALAAAGHVRTEPRTP